MLAASDWRYLSEGNSHIVFASLPTAASLYHSVLLKLHKPSLRSAPHCWRATHPQSNAAADEAATEVQSKRHTALGSRVSSHATVSLSALLLTSAAARYCRHSTAVLHSDRR